MHRENKREGYPLVSDRNNARDDLRYHDDGSVDLYFGPEPPDGYEDNWIQTAPGKGWFLLLRLYGPLEAWFDQTWRPGDVETPIGAHESSHRNWR